MSKPKPPHLPAAEFDAAQEFLDWCRAQLGLPHWNVYVGRWGACPRSAYADIDVNVTRYMARVRLAREWETLDAWTQANVMLHETVHVLHHRLTEGIGIEVRLAMSGKRQRAFDVIEARTRLEYERMSDRLATALVEPLRAVPTWERIRTAHGLATLHA